MTTIEQKSISNYWIKKIKNSPLVNSVEIENPKIKSIQVDRNSISFFSKLTNENTIAELTVLLTVFNALLQRYFEIESFIFSSKVNNDGITLLYKNTQASGKSFKDYLQEIKKEVQEAYTYSEYEDKLQENYPFSKYALFGFFYNSKTAPTNHNFPFSLSVTKNDNAIELIISYDSSFVEDSVADHFLNSYANWLLHLDLYINETVDKIAIVSLLEKEQLLHDFNPAAKDYANKTLVELFEEQAVKIPDNTAIIFKNKELTYKELNQRANQLAHYLRKKYSIQPNDLVGIKLERNEFVPIVLLGILKSGAAYVPIEINYPEERIQYIEKDSQCKLVIDENHLRNYLNDAEHSNNTDNPKAINHHKDLAYIIYTSGTTGNPKGVMISHQNAVVLIYWSQEEYNTDAFEIVYAATSYCFDLSVYELFYPLSIGKKIRILENALEIGEALQHDKKVLVNTVPSSIRHIIESGYSLKNTTIINLAGEPFPVDLSKKLLDTNAEIRNLYGPSEDTTYSTAYKLSAQKEYTTSVSIGKPISNTKVYILDKNLELLPVGIAGKLYISGDGLSKGYLNRAELTAEKFIPNPFSDSVLMYDTGDMAKWLPDGTIDFLGRKDYQVKLRGYRVELGEIENAILSFSENVTQVVVLVLQNNAVQSLVAYFTKNKTIDEETLKSYLKEKLPAYMVPNYFIVLDKIPLTPNGKTDRKVLENLPLHQVSNANYVAPGNEIEKTLVAIWQEILGIEKIGIEDNFFDLGGHSLMIGQVINNIYKRLNGTISYKELFLAPTIEQISQKIRKENYHSIPKTEVQNYYPLTASQHKMWVLSQFEGGNSAYNMHGAVKLTGNVDVLKLEKAFNLLIAKYEILRTYFKAGYNGEISQYILEEGQWKFNLIQENYSNKSKEELSQYLNEQQAAIFDLTNAPLLKAALLKTEENVHILSLVMQHIIGDGWSLELLISEIVTTYNNLVQGNTIDFSITIQYKDYAIWMQSQENEKSVLDSEKYWLSVFKEQIPVLELPGYKSRPAKQTYNGNTLTYSFSEAFLSKLKQFSKTNNATPFMTLMAGVNALLYRYTNQNDIILGTPVAGREHPDLENQLGLFLNTLAIKTKITGTDSFSALLDVQRKTLIDAYEHQNYAFSSLVNKLNLKRDASRSALFDVLVVLQNQAQLKTIHTNALMEGVAVEPFEIKRNTSQFDLSFVFTEKKEEMLLNLEYNTDIYDEFWINAIFKHFENLLSIAFKDANVTIDAIEYLEESEKELLLKTFNENEIYFPKEATIVDLLELQADKTPDDCALIFNDAKLTYKELHEQSNQLAHYLRENYDIIPNDLVGVRLKRDEHLVIVILAVLKSGAAYVPIDVNYPVERINYIIEDSNCKVVIDEKELNQFLLKKQNSAKENLQKINKAEDLAYVIYTSGTTGKPKGVLITHKNVTAFLYWAKKEFNTGSFDLVYAATSHCFDLSAYEMFFTLSVGKTIKLLGNALEISKELKKDKRVLINTVPSSIRSLIEEDFSALENASIINLAGEPFPVDIARELLNTTAEIRNLYGPSEDTTYSTYYKLEKDKKYKSIPIGKPIANTQVYILDENLQLTPLGIVGKLYLAGEGVALGYLNKEELSATKFIKNPFIKDSIMYDTGDLVKWFPDGNIEYLGRKDHQVKLRGYRIELEEIENSLLQISDTVKQVVVVVKHFKGTDILAAYYTGGEGISKNDFKEYLQNILPGYMIPQYYIEVPFIPLSPNGKTDKEALPDIDENTAISNGLIAPTGRIEKTLALIWKDILGLETISSADDFFSLGGHSLKLGQLINKINEQFQVTVSFEKLFEYPVLKDQAELIKNSFSNNFTPIVSVPNATSYEMSYAQKSLWMVSQFRGKDIAYNIPAVYHFHGNFDIQAFKEAFNLVIRKHEILRTVFKEDEEKNIKQFIIPSSAFQFSVEYEDFSTNTDKELVLKIEIQQTTNFAFDLFKGPLFKAKLVRLDDEHYAFLFVIHHIISDAWSLQLLIEEISANYNSILQKQVVDSSPLAIQYKEYSHWLKNEIKTNAITNTYWMNELQGHLRPLKLNYDYLPQTNADNQGGKVDFCLNTEANLSIKKIAKKLNVTEFTFHLAAFFSFLNLQTAETDIILGVPFAGRAHANLEDQLGYYVNLLPIRLQLHQNENFETIIKMVQDKLSNAFENQMYPIDLILRDLEFERGERGTNFINTGFTWNDLALDEFRINENLTAKVQNVPTEQVKYDLWIISNGSNFILEYRKDLFSRDSIDLFVERYLVFLEALSKNTAGEIASYSFKTQSEKQLESSRINIEINF